VKRLLLIGLLTWFGSDDSAFAQATNGSIPPIGKEWAEVEIDRVPPPEALALGHHGLVVIEGDVSSENRVSNSVVVVSSRSSILDAAALKSYGNARIDAELLKFGPKRIRLKIEIGNYDFGNMGIGYLCKQAVTDADWYAGSHPDQPVATNKFKTFLRGMGLINRWMAFAQDDKRFEAAWQRTLATCRNRPTVPVLGIITLVGNGKTVPN
jgi:TonB family protein